MEYRNTLQKGSVRYLVFKDGDTFFAVALEFNIVVEGTHPIYYTGRYGGQPRQTHIQFHGAKAIHPRTLKSVIRQSGIPQKEWLG